jgi:hypothetical protein
LFQKHIHIWLTFEANLYLTCRLPLNKIVNVVTTSWQLQVVYSCLHTHWVYLPSLSYFFNIYPQTQPTQASTQVHIIFLSILAPNLTSIEIKGEWQKTLVSGILFLQFLSSYSIETWKFLFLPHINTRVRTRIF